MKEIDQKLDEIYDWANQKVAGGKEPPWSWYQFMKLKEAIEAIRTGVTHIPTEYLQQSDESLETAHQPQALVLQLDNARRHLTDKQEPWPK